MEKFQLQNYCYEKSTIKDGGMSEREELLESIANTISSYRTGEIEQPDAGHVDRWASQFAPNDQELFLREFDHVIRKTFFTRDRVVSFLERLITNQDLAGEYPHGYWSKANFLQIQQNGQSQREMAELFEQSLFNKLGLELDECGSPEGDYIYLDDVLFTGNRVATDLEAWIENEAPEKAAVNVIVMALHTSGLRWLKKTRLKEFVAKSGKEITIKYWRAAVQENQLFRRDSADVLWPSEIPEDQAVQAYIDSLERYPFMPRSPGGPLGVFSSEEGRQLLESEFLKAGVVIRSKNQHPKDFHRPLGCSRFGVGFGSLIATYRNCPNNTPLALWWGDPEVTSGPLHWYPLLPRKPYTSVENVFGIIIDDV